VLHYSFPLSRARHALIAGRGLLLVGVALLLAGLAFAGSAQAATTLGQTGNNHPCGGSGYSEVQAATAGSPSYEVPVDGSIITSWSVLGNADTDDVLKLRIFRPTGTPDQFKVVGESTQQGPLQPAVLNGPFPTSIPVEAGDLLGLNVVAGTDPPCIFTTPNPADVSKEFLPDNTPVGGTETATDTFTGSRVNVSATLAPLNEFTFGDVEKNKKKGTAKLVVEVPGPGTVDLAGKGLKPSSADATDAGEVQLAVKTKGKTKKKLKKKGKKKVKPSVTFTPTNGEPNTESTKVKLVKK
jgi:hypothetical protein